MSAPSLSHGMILREPASRWQDALPLGNGTLGALVYGHIAHELITWNHGAFWRRTPKPELPDVSARLPELRALLAAGNTATAREFWQKAIGTTFNIDPYQPGFDLEWTQAAPGIFSHYRRHLDLEHGEAIVTWRTPAGEFTRTTFVSQPDQVGVVHWQAPAGVTADVTLRLAATGLQQHSSMGAHGAERASPEHELAWQTEWRADGLGFCHGAFSQLQVDDDPAPACSGAVRIIAPGATLRIEGERCVIRGATTITLLVTAVANEPRDISWPIMAEGLRELPDYAALRERHHERAKALFNRATLRLGPANSGPVDVARAQAEGADGQVPTAWLATLHDFGRHLLHSASWPGDFPRTGWPANLQGIWNGSREPAWASDIHNDVNIEMNYWPALTGALPETMIPFFAYFEHHLPDYRANAQKLFGCRGIYVPISQGTHGVARPSPWNCWTAGAGWIAQHFYDYYLYTGDRVFLRDRTVPFLREAAWFYEDFITLDATGRARFNPSLSPENTPLNSPLRHAIVCTDATMDAAVARELLTNLLSACRALDLHHDECPRWEKLLAALPLYQIAPDGQLREWLDDASIDNPHHRHISHLYGAFPGWEINETTPELAAAVKRSLDARLTAAPDEQTGWSLAAQAATWARLGEGDRALDCLEWLARFCTGPNGFTYHNDWRGQGPTMFWGHGNPPPFQIDANFGLTAAVQEMLLQSRPGVIKLLPALPAKWTEGTISGWQTRVGVKVDLQWSHGGQTWSATLTAERDTEFLLVSSRTRLPNPNIKLSRGATLSL